MSLRPAPILLALAALASPAAARAGGPSPFEWKDGDRVVLVGDTLIERDQKYGYLETILTARNPDKAITFRNLGWSADTVRGLSRARFGPPAEGYSHLIEHVRALKPTVLIVGYGMADSFDGEAGLPSFVSGLNGLLDAVKESNPRVILLSPIAHADLGRPWPDPAAHNKDLERYTKAIAKVAADRGSRFVDVFHKWPDESNEADPLTDNGIHLTDLGYWLFGVFVADDLLDPPTPWRVQFHHNGRLGEAQGTKVTVDKTRPSGVRFEALDAALPAPPKQFEISGVEFRIKEFNRTLVAENLPAGSYKLTVDGAAVSLAWDVGLSTLSLNLNQPSSRFPNEALWAKGVRVTAGPEFAQVEALRAAINRKNELYFYRWRPQNETYLFGFRKHEQGNNAREIPLFDPLVEEQEKRIATLKKPVPHVYELTREKDPAPPPGAR